MGLSQVGALPLGTVAPLVAFWAVFALVFALGERQSRIGQRLARHRVRIADGRAESAPPGGETRALRQLTWLTRIEARLGSEKRVAQDRQLLSLAGSPMSIEAYTRLRRIVSFAVAPILAVLVLWSFSLKPLGFGAAAIMLLVVPRLPAIALKRRARARAREMDRVIADVLDLMVVCVEGGQSLSAALLQISRRMDTIAAEEFSHLLADINSGISRRDAFTALAERCQSEALAITCSTIIHADKVGMSLAHTLRTLSDMMRTRRRQAAEARARQAPIKMMPVLVGFMLPTLLVLLLGPVVLEVMAVFR